VIEAFESGEPLLSATVPRSVPACANRGVVAPPITSA
jgi:hypothetical protein